MGYWNTSREGVSFALDFHRDGSPLIWGDPVSDVYCQALREIIEIFTADVGRAPSIEELVAGLKFAAASFEEDGELSPGGAPTSPRR